ncbi:hypothetical protein ABXN37_19790 [Piscinibacter sakaiensis]|uniref:hypothetical protein n=1 Tax=Piscinibacter sakaiensis TaxID=1547922 RepID=UPI0006B69EEF|nr:hypothetical protein [Piscinibacter sakaiensis]
MTAADRACMGGWCTDREDCAAYHAEHGRAEAVERLCRPGAEVVRPLHSYLNAGVRVMRAPPSTQPQ